MLQKIKIHPDKIIEISKQINKYAAPIIILFVIVVIVAWMGVDFGFHWDEDNHTLGVTKKYIQNRNLLPGHYIYPPFTSLLSLSVVIPYLVPFLRNYLGQVYPAEIQSFLIYEVLENPTYRINVRQTFVMVGALSLVWIYLYKLKEGRHWVEGILAAAILGFSWEIGYHLHWIASDAILMQFGGLTLLLSYIAYKSSKRQSLWIGAAAFSAGLATSVKYTGGSILLIVMLAVYLLWEKNEGLKSLTRRYLWVGIFYAFGYLLITPGSILEFEIFSKHLILVNSVYATGHGTHTVQPGFGPLWLYIQYFATVSLSSNSWMAFGLFFAGLVGVRSLWQESKRDALFFLSFPVIYVIFFSTRSVMFVRNMLVIFPFLAILSGRGIVYLYEKIKPRNIKYGFAVVVIAVLGFNLNYLVYSANSIQDRGTDRFIIELSEFISEQPEILFFISEQVAEDLGETNRGLPLNVTQELISDVDMVVVYFYESSDIPGLWAVNFPGAAPKWFGPREVNLDYYASWRGDDRILYMSLDKAKEMKLNIVRQGLVE